MGLVIVVASGFCLGLLAPLLHRWLGDRVGYVLALLPTAIAVYLARFIGRLDEVSIAVDYSWLPSWGLSL